MGNNETWHSILGIEMDEVFEKKLAKLAFNSSKSVRNLSDKVIMEEGFILGYSRVSDIPEDKMNNAKFKTGYARGLRTRTAEEYQQRIETVEEMVKNNISFDMADDEIKKDENLYAHYLLSQNRLRLEQLKKGKNK